MERIAQALAKARAEREGAAEAEAKSSPAALASSLDQDAEITARWQDLREVEPAKWALVRNHLVAVTGEQGADQFAVMRTKLLHAMRLQNWTRVGITSPGPGCGKTTIALNLAFGLARQPSLRVALVDADLRRPSLSRALGVKLAISSADFLMGRSSLVESTVRLRPNLAALMGPAPFAQPAELFQSVSTAATLAELEASLVPNLVLFDLPPLLAGDDVLAFSAHLDAVLIVIAAGITTAAELDACERDLVGRTNIIGVVLNRAPASGKTYAYDLEK